MCKKLTIQFGESINTALAKQCDRRECSRTAAISEAISLQETLDLARLANFGIILRCPRTGEETVIKTVVLLREHNDDRVREKIGDDQ